MKLEQSFEVDAPLESVWEALIDVQRVAPCLPGAEITEAGDDGTYHGLFSVKIGPAKAAYRGTLKMESVDREAHRVTMYATGTDKRGQGGAKATMVSVMRERAGGGTHVDVETDMHITGRLASFSRGGMIQDVSNRLLRDFASCLQATLATEQADAADQPVAPGTAAGAGAPAGEDVAAAAASGVGAGTTGITAGGAGPELSSVGTNPATGGTGAAAGGPASAAPPRTATRRTPPPAQAGKPIGGLRLMAGVLWDRLRRLVRRARARRGG